MQRANEIFAELQNLGEKSLKDWILTIGIFEGAAFRVLNLEKENPLSKKISFQVFSRNNSRKENVQTKSHGPIKIGILWNIRLLISILKWRWLVITRVGQRIRKTHPVRSPEKTSPEINPQVDVLAFYEILDCSYLHLLAFYEILDCSYLHLSWNHLDIKRSLLHLK